MELKFNIKDFEVMFDQSSEEFYIDSQDFKLALAEDLSNCDVLESKISIKFEGEIRNFETVLGKSYSIGEFGEEREEVKAICTADLSRWRTEKEKVYFNTSIDLD